MRIFVQIATKDCNFNKIWLSLFRIKTYTLIHQFGLFSFGAQRQFFNLQCVYIRSLQFIFSDLRLLVVERVSTCQYNRLKIPFVLFSQTAGSRLYWYRRQCDLSHLTSNEEDSGGSS